MNREVVRCKHQRCNYIGVFQLRQAEVADAEAKHQGHQSSDNAFCHTDKMRACILFSGPWASSALDALIAGSNKCHTPVKSVTCITNTSHDLSVSGLRFAPDIDRAIYSSSPGLPRTTSVTELLQQWSLAPGGEWPELDDAATASAVARGFHLARGLNLTEAVAQQVEAAGCPHEVLPITDTPVEQHVVETADDGTASSRHVLRWIHAAHRHSPDSFVIAGLDQAHATTAALQAIREADVVIVPPMSPVLDAAGLLGVQGVRDALRGTSAHVVVISPTQLGAARPDDVEAAAWATTGLPATASTIAKLYGDFADALLIDDDEPPARYPTNLQVQRLDVRGAVHGDAHAQEALAAAILPT